MAGFVYQTVHPHGNARANNNMCMEAPYYGYGFYNINPGVQNINEDVTPQNGYGFFNGSGVRGNVYSQPAQRQMYRYEPNGANNGNGSATWVHVGPNQYHMNRRTQTIQADVVQRGSFKGRGRGAKLCGHFSVSGDIN